MNWCYRIKCSPVSFLNLKYLIWYFYLSYLQWFDFDILLKVWPALSPAPRGTIADVVRASPRRDPKWCCGRLPALTWECVYLRRMLRWPAPWRVPLRRMCSCVPPQRRMDAYLPCWLEGCRLRLASVFLDVVIRLCCDVTPTLSLAPTSL